MEVAAISRIPLRVVSEGGEASDIPAPPAAEPPGALGEKKGSTLEQPRVGCGHGSGGEDGRDEIGLLRRRGVDLDANSPGVPDEVRGARGAGIEGLRGR